MKNVWFNKTFSSIHSALRLIRSGDTDSQYRIIATNPNPHSIAGLAADCFMTEPSGLKGDEYLVWCLDFCRQESVSIFLPGKEAAFLSGKKEQFEAAGVRLLAAADSENLGIINDKQRFYETVKSDVAPPALWKPCTNLAEFDQAFETLLPQCGELCIKPAVSVYGIGFRRIRTDTTAFRLFSGGAEYQIDLLSLRTMLAEAGSFKPLLVMDFLDGHEYSVDCIADHGRLACAVARKKPLNPGHGQIIDDRADILQASEQIVSQFSLNGMINIQFREKADRLYILEVNPRMSGGIAMACLAGPNLPYLGLAGFDKGYDRLCIEPVKSGIRVGEINLATVLE